MTEPLGVQDTSGLTDADWAEINRLRKIYDEKGGEGLNKAFAELMQKDLIRYARVVDAFFPNELTEALKDEMAERGMTEEDVRELIRRLESPARDQ